jgi:hypothetical protein
VVLVGVTALVLLDTGAELDTDAGVVVVVPVVAAVVGVAVADAVVAVVGVVVVVDAAAAVLEGGVIRASASLVSARAFGRM